MIHCSGSFLFIDLVLEWSFPGFIFSYIEVMMSELLGTLLGDYHIARLGQGVWQTVLMR